MAERNAQFYQLLTQIDDQLSTKDRAKLSFLLKDDVPRYILDEISHNSRIPLTDLWQALIDRSKISPNDLKYLINFLKVIERHDLVRRAERYLSAGQPAANQSTHLFRQIDPQN